MSNTPSTPNTPDEFDTWDTETGLKDDYNLNVYLAYFATDANYQDGQTTLLHLEGEDADTSEPAVEKYSCGSGWYSHDGGKTIQHESGKPRRINRSSMYGRIIEWTKGQPALLAIMRDRGTALQADSWVNLRFHMLNQEVTFGKNLEARHRNLPVEFLGTIDKDGQLIQPTLADATKPPRARSSTPLTPQSATLSRAEQLKRAAIAKQQASAAQQVQSTQEEVSPLQATLISLARSSATHGDFMIAALELDEVITDDDAMNMVADDSQESFYNTHHG